LDSNALVASVNLYIFQSGVDQPFQLTEFSRTNGFALKATLAPKVIPFTPKVPILVRLFDSDGHYLTHFVTSERFTMNEIICGNENRVYENSMRVWSRFGETPEQHGDYKALLLRETGNSFVYPVSRRHLRDAAIVEIGFYQRK